MTYSLSNNCTKNYYNWTLTVQVIVEDVVTWIFLKHSVDYSDADSHRNYIASLNNLTPVPVPVPVGLAAPKPPSQVIGISAGISISCRNSTSGLNFISGSTFIPRPPRARDRVTMDGGGRSYTSTGHSGCRISFPGRRDGTQLAGQIARS